MAPLPDELFLLSAILAREKYTGFAMDAAERGEGTLASFFEELAMLVGVYESDLELGLDSDVILPDFSDEDF